MTRARTLSRLANATVLTVDGSNNVGINSTIPDAKLDVIGIVSATSFYGSGANLTDVISGVELKSEGSSVGTAITQIDFSGATLTTPHSGLSTISIAKQLTIGVRVGSAVTFSISGSSFNVIAKGGGNIPITV